MRSVSVLHDAHILSKQKSGVNQSLKDRLALSNSGLTGCYVLPRRGCYKELTKASSMQPKKKKKKKKTTYVTS